LDNVKYCASVSEKSLHLPSVSSLNFHLVVLEKFDEERKKFSHNLSTSVTKDVAKWPRNALGVDAN